MFSLENQHTFGARPESAAWGSRKYLNREYIFGGFRGISEQASRAEAAFASTDRAGGGKTGKTNLRAAAY